MKFHLISLGCPKNTYDSELLIDELRRSGWQWESSPESANVILLNTCGFIKEAKEESLEHIFQLAKIKEKIPQTHFIVFGCLVQRYQEQLLADIPEVDIFLKFPSAQDIIDKLANPYPEASLRVAFRGDPGTKNVSPKKAQKKQSDKTNHGPTIPRVLTPKHIGYLKIAEGCDNKCSYCAIPGIRGPFHSANVAEILHRAQELQAGGARELNVIAQDTTRFGSDSMNEWTLPDLVKQLGELPIDWIRIHYLHPARLTPQKIDDLFRLPKVIPYFDIPFQHASDRILNLMNRGTTNKHHSQILRHIRRHYRNSIVRSTFIVGFPGEFEPDFKELIDFIQEHPIDRLGAFPYSTEDQTSAAKITPKISKRIKTQRLDRLMTLQQLLAHERNQRFVGKRIQLLIDQIDDDKIIARTPGDAYGVDNSTMLPPDPTCHVGDLIFGRIIRADAYDFYAEKVK